MRKGFTLVELMISISILSIVMIFLYKSYASLNHLNTKYAKGVKEIKKEELRKEVLFLDFSLAFKNSVAVLNQNKKTDVVFLQSSHSIHRRYNPYIAYIVNDSKLYRLESLNQFKTYPLSADSEFSIEYFGEVNSFRVYKSHDIKDESFLVHVDFSHDEDILLKINILDSL